MIFVKSDFYLILMTVTENIRGETFCNRRGNWTKRGMQQDLCLKGLGWDDPTPRQNAMRMSTKFNIWSAFYFWSSI